MTDQILITRPGAFEARMALRDRMMVRAGVSFPTSDIPQEIAERNAISVAACMDCPNSTACAHWLDTEPAHGPAPEFCANASLIDDMRNHR